MADIRLRELERRALRTGAWEDVLAVRRELKRVGLSAGLDLSVPHVWGLVGAGKNENLRYGQALAVLRAQCSADVKESGHHPFEDGKVRPLTFKENIQARIAQYKATGKAGSLWTSLLDSCSAIVYEGGTTRFKIVPLSPHLLVLEPSFRQEFVSRVVFDQIPGEPLDAQDDAYNALLTQEQIVNPREKDPKQRYHKGWLAALEGDGALLEEYTGLVFGLLRHHQAMGFFTVPRRDEMSGNWIFPDKDQLRALCAFDLGAYCYCIGNRYLNDDDRLARVCPP